MPRIEPTISEKIESIMDEGELTGFVGQLMTDGRYDARAKSLVEMRRHELRTMKGWK